MTNEETRVEGGWRRFVVLNFFAGEVYRVVGQRHGLLYAHRVGGNVSDIDIISDTLPRTQVRKAVADVASDILDGRRLPK